MPESERFAVVADRENVVGFQERDQPCTSMLSLGFQILWMAGSCESSFQSFLARFVKIWRLYFSSSCT